MSDDTEAKPPTPSLAMVVPIPTLAQPGNYLRLGVASVDDELNLAVDPARAGQGAPTVGSTSQAPPFGTGTVIYSVDGIKMVGPHGYLRIGETAPYEGWLSSDDSQPVTSPASGSPARDPIGRTGMLLYSPETVQTVGKNVLTVAPFFTLYNNEKLAVTGDTTAVVSASLTSGDSQAPITTSFERLIQLKAQLGSAYGFTVGDSINHVIGGFATVSSGVKMISNVGQTQNIVAGQQIGITNSAVKVDGWRAVHAAPAPYALASVELIDLACSPAPEMVRPLSSTLMARATAVSALVAAAAEAGMAVVTDTLTMTDWRGEDTLGDAPADERIRGTLKHATWEMVSTDSLVVVLQAMTLLTGLAAKSATSAAVGAPLASLSMTMGDITMRMGGSMMIMTDGAIIFDSPAFIVNSAETIFA